MNDAHEELREDEKAVLLFNPFIKAKTGEEIIQELNETGKIEWQECDTI